MLKFENFENLKKSDNSHKLEFDLKIEFHFQKTNVWKILENEN